METPNGKRFWTAQQVADRLGISNKMVYDLAQKGVIRSHKFGWLVRFNPDDIDKYIEQSRRVPGPSPVATA